MGKLNRYKFISSNKLLRSSPIKVGQAYIINESKKIKTSIGAWSEMDTSGIFVIIGKSSLKYGGWKVIREKNHLETLDEFIEQKLKKGTHSFSILEEDIFESLKRIK